MVRDGCDSASSASASRRTPARSLSSPPVCRTTSPTPATGGARRVEIRPALKMEQLFETAVALAEQGRTMLGGIPKPLELALFTREFDQEVQAAFPPRWLQRLVLAPLAWVARLRGRDSTCRDGLRRARNRLWPSPTEGRPDDQAAGETERLVAG